MNKRQQLEQIIKLIIEQNNQILKVRGGRGYGNGHPVFFKAYPSPNLGPENKEEEVQQDEGPVKISKAFKNKKRKSND
jgi:hypothetical protein